MIEDCVISVLYTFQVTGKLIISVFELLLLLPQDFFLIPNLLVVIIVHAIFITVGLVYRLDSMICHVLVVIESERLQPFT